MMKHVVRTSLCLSLICLGGCYKKRTKLAQGGEGVPASQQATDNTGSTRISLFDEHENAFVLEEEEHAFISEGTIRVAEDALFDDHRPYVLETIYFGFDSYAVTPEYAATIDRMVAIIKPRIAAKAIFVIEGHACNSAGSAEYNMMLSEKRAHSVKAMLVKRGIPANQLKTVGRGFELCKVSHGTREQQAPNRRVEVYELTDTAGA